VNRKELSEVVAEAAARTERAAALQREAMARAEAARAKQEEAIARQEAASVKQEEAIARQEAVTARIEEAGDRAADRNKKLDALLANLDELLKEMREDRARVQAEREDEKVWREEYLRRQEKMFQDFFARADAAVAEGRANTEKILARIDDQRDDTRAMQEAIMKLIDRLPPPPPHLRSA
jgi:hypothetical protein